MLCLATLAMVGMSWPLWTGGTDFPRVPFLLDWPSPPPGSGWVVPSLIVVGLALAAWGWAWRWMLGGTILLIGFEVVGDQDRFQPWIYQFLVVGLVLATTRGRLGWTLARLFVASIYFYSGLSKLDVPFVREMGSTFLDAAMAPTGLDSSRWPGAFRTALILMMPAWEVAIAAGLMSRRARRLATVGAMAQHLATIGILGPWGLGHSTIVLAWNLALAAEAWLLFWPDVAEDRGPPTPPGLRIATTSCIGFVLIWPLGERSGLCDSWPGHALYASHAERTEVDIHEVDASIFPGSVVRRLGPAGVDSYRRLDLTGWSRDLRGTPVYPQGRVGQGVAEHLAASFRPRYPVRVVQWGRDGIFGGGRERVTCLGLRAIQRRGETYRLNAHPHPHP